MKKPTISTIILIIVIAIIGLYALGEVDYYSMKITTERNVDSPVITIPAIGLSEKINNISLSQGVYRQIDTYTPDTGDVVLYGHRTLQGSPFLRLDQVNKGDELVVEWPEIGELKYTVTNKEIVPANYQLTTVQGGHKLFLVTCDPIGSTANRLIIEGELSSQGPIQEQIIKDNPQEYYGLIIATLFLIGGLIFSWFYSKDNRIYLIVTVLIISAIIFYFYLFPIPPDIIFSKIGFLNGEFA
ncbi:MAG: class E sortase [Methanobrevibacter sp.]|uniref:class E sortase n=1 Tax=Methanobrevibacter sp. TaxID=66852 RepID=UPI0026E03E4C|nr:class E sortase [Methanobrevibacter sp.]MDO5848172.1 class E sortase [Methanobrevibacter sp.]